EYRVFLTESINTYLFSEIKVRRVAPKKNMRPFFWSLRIAACLRPAADPSRDRPAFRRLALKRCGGVVLFVDSGGETSIRRRTGGVAAIGWSQPAGKSSHACVVDEIRAAPTHSQPLRRLKDR